MHTCVVHNRPLLHRWLNRNLDVQMCIKSASFLHVEQPHWIANASFFSCTSFMCACTCVRAYIYAFFFLSVISRQPAYHLRDGRDDRSMEQSAADVIMNFDATARIHRSSLFILIWINYLFSPREDQRLINSCFFFLFFFFVTILCTSRYINCALFV